MSPWTLPQPWTRRRAHRCLDHPQTDGPQRPPAVSSSCDRSRVINDNYFGVGRRRCGWPDGGVRPDTYRIDEDGGAAQVVFDEPICHRERRSGANGGQGFEGARSIPSPDPNVRTLGRLAMTLSRCHCQLCASEVFSPRQPLPCGLAGRCAGVIDVARARCCPWSAAVTGRLFPGVTRSPLSVVLAALSPLRRADWSRSCPCPLPTWSVRSSSRSLVSVDTCGSSRAIGSCT